MEPNIRAVVSGFVRGVTFLMVAALFFVWFVLGSNTIAKQNQQILDGIQARQGVVLERINAEVDGLVCILRIDPDHRTTKNVNRCLRNAGL